MAEKFVYYMHRLTKIYPPKKEVLKEISLSFYYGAKIGIIGVNGSGKSTLMRIMAGLDTEYLGEAWVESGRTKGYLPQEPRLDETLTVGGNVELAVKATRDLLKEFDEVSMMFSKPLSDADMNKLMERQARLQDKIDAEDAWELDRRLEIAMDALRCPPADTDVRTLSGGERRRVALCKLLLEKPDLLLLDEPTSNVDTLVENRLLELLRELNRRMTILMVSHDLGFVSEFVDRVICVNRRVAVHPTREMTGDAIRDIYGGEVRMVRHNEFSHSE